MNISQLVHSYVRLKKCGMECAARQKLEQLKCKLNNRQAAHHQAAADLPSSHRLIRKPALIASDHFG